jgi:hypothetical protein
MSLVKGGREKKTYRTGHASKRSMKIGFMVLKFEQNA